MIGVALNLKIDLQFSPGWKDYELVDSGGGVKLERFGAYLFIRPEHQAIWSAALPGKGWEAAHAVFLPGNGESGGQWNLRRTIQSPWMMQYKNLKFWAQLTKSRHLGVFPEQASHWDWLGEQSERAGRQLKILNLFGYTGLASLALAAGGALVTHVDASKKAIAQARANQAASGLDSRGIRWIVDDALKFVQRERRRQSLYDGILLDPPKFGRGPKGELWECFDMLPGLLQACRALLTGQPAFFVVTAYAIRASALSLYHALEGCLSGLGGVITAGELVTRESSAGRVISNAIYARWSPS